MTVPFRPMGATVTLATTTASASAAVLSEANSMRCVNVGPNVVFLAYGPAAVVATVAAGIPLLVNETARIVKGGAPQVAAICGTGTATVYFTPCAD